MLLSNKHFIIEIIVRKKTLAVKLGDTKFPFSALVRILF